MTKGMPIRMRLSLAVAAALTVSAFAAPLAVAQSPDDIPGFDQLPLPGGEDPAAEPTESPTDGTGGDPSGPQVDAPGGGVDTGAGGLAADGAPVALGAAGALAAMGGAVFVARRRLVRG